MIAFFGHVADHFFLEIKYKCNQHHLSSESITEKERKLISLTPLRYNYLLFAIDRVQPIYNIWLIKQRTTSVSTQPEPAKIQLFGYV